MEMEYRDPAKRGKFIVVIGILLAVAAGGAAFYLINQAQQKAGQGTLQKTDVIVAVQAIPARKPIEAVPVSPSHFIHFRRGFVTNLLNPKAAVFFIAVLPEFTQGPAPSARELALLVSVYVGIATLVHGLVVVPAGGLQMLFAAPQRRKMAGNIFAVLLLAIAVWLFVSGRR